MVDDTDSSITASRAIDRCAYRLFPPGSAYLYYSTAPLLPGEARSLLQEAILILPGLVSVVPVWARLSLGLDCFGLGREVLSNIEIRSLHLIEGYS